MGKGPSTLLDHVAAPGFKRRVQLSPGIKGTQKGTPIDPGGCLKPDTYCFVKVEVPKSLVFFAFLLYINRIELFNEFGFT